MSTATPSLESLALPFRHRPLDDDELTRQVHAWADAYPHLCKVTPLVRTPQQRTVWLLTLGGHAAGSRPTVWVDGNMHASELSGSSVALAVAESVLRIHLEGTVQGIPAHLVDVLRGLAFMVVPRISPDGAAAVLKTGGYVRSVPRDERVVRTSPFWRAEDVDGDGTALLMRQVHPCGDFVESRVVPGLMVPRVPEDAPPYFKLYPEGVVENFDGHTVPDPYFLSDNDTDLNRNFPYLWAQEPVQEGSGSHPLSAPEARAVVEHVVKHPEIFAWVNLHTFGGVFIRPMGDQPDTKMKDLDLCIYRQLGAWAESITGYPMVSGFEEFTYSPDTPLHGALSDYAFMQRGCVSYVTELWDLFARAGLARKKRFVDHYAQLTREDVEKIGRHDLDHNAGRAIRPWKRVKHPQLGDVEVGGLDTREGISNPPRELMPETCERHTRMTLMLASLAPQLHVGTTTEKLGDGLHRVRVVVENRGYLSTHILESARELPHAEEVHVHLEAQGCTVDGPALRVLGHLEGWGRGLGNSGHAIFFPRSLGTGHTRTHDVLVRGQGTLTVRARSARAGQALVRVEIPGT